MERPENHPGGLKVVDGQCDSCVFSKASPVRSARMRALRRAWVQQDTHQVCHHFGVEGDDERSLDGENVVCGGFFDNVFMHSGVGQLLRIAGRLGGYEYISAPTTAEMRHA